MKHQCKYKQDRRSNWIKTVLAFKSLIDCLPYYGSERKRSTTREQLPASRKHKNGVEMKYCKQKQSRGSYIKEDAQQKSTKRIWQFHNKRPFGENATRSLLCRWCKCLSGNKSFPYSYEDSRICMKISDMPESLVSVSKAGSLRTATCSKGVPDIACKVRQLRNKIIKTTSTMELDTTNFESFTGILLLILERIPDLENNKWQHATEKIAQLKECDFIITDDDEVVAYETVKKYLDERENEIQRVIDDILDTGTLEGESCQQKNIFQEYCPCQLDGNDNLQMLKNTVTKLIPTNSYLLDDEHAGIKDLVLVEKELELLLNVQSRPRRELGILTKKEKDTKSDSSFVGIALSKTAQCTTNGFQCEPGNHETGDEPLTFSLENRTAYTNECASNIQSNTPPESTHIRQTCKVIYPTIDLKTREESADNSLTSCQDEEHCHSSKDGKKDDERSNSYKNVIRGGSEEFIVKTDIVVAPASQTHSKGGKQMQQTEDNPNETDNASENENETTVLEASENHHGDEINGACADETLTCISYTQAASRSEGVCCDGYTSENMSHYSKPTVQVYPVVGITRSAANNDNIKDSSVQCSQVLTTEKDSHTQCNTKLNSSHLTCHTSVISNESSITPSNLPNPDVDRNDIQRFERLMQIIDKIAGGERVPPQITMRYEMLRFCTLRSYPKENKPFITRIAQAGFYYANSGDEVVCYTCARRKSNWREDDVPMDIHRQLNPNCGFLLRNSEVNVPIRLSESLLENSTIPAYQQTLQNGNATATASTPNATSHNTLKRLHQATVQTSLSSSNTFQMATQNNTGLVSSTSIDTASSNRMPSRPHGNFVQTVETSAIALTRQSHHTAVSSSTFGPSSDGSLTPASQNIAEGTNRSAMPKYPKYASKTVRDTSFNDCGDIVVQPDSLADSGFFYAGFGDCVRCFQCGVGLRHWSEEDDPWIEHSRWSKDCAFVRQVKGQEFVNLVQMAVQYSQNQSEQTPGDSTSTTGTNQEATANGDIETLMHTDAAQSVLEMGYNPNVIRRAIRAIREINDQEELTAVNVMEKIFALEEADNSVNSPQILDPLQQSSTSQASQVRSELPSVGTNADNNTTRSQTSAEINRTASSNAPSAQSAVSEDMPSVSTLPGGPEMISRAQKKSQLLEQKKLKEENEKLKQQSICTKCHQNDVCIVFLPCGHLVTCETCAPTVRYCTVQECGKYIKGTVRTYLS